MPDIKPTEAELRSRFMHHPPIGDQADRYATIRRAIGEAAKVCVLLSPASPEQQRALDRLDEAMYNFIAAIARTETVPAAG